jgi:C1A family cysteine protease
MRMKSVQRILSAGMILGFSGIGMPQPGNDKFYVKRENAAKPAVKQELDKLRLEIKTRKYSFEVGYTTVMDNSLESITGAKEPENFEAEARLQNLRARKLSLIDDSARAAYLERYPKKEAEINAGFAVPKICPIRKALTVKHTCVRDEKYCAGSWVFSVVGPLEGSWLIRNNKVIDASEQYVLCFSKCGVQNCGDCYNGGWPACAACFLVKTGTATEKAYPYNVTSGKAICPPYVGPLPYKAVAWNYVDSTAAIPSVLKIKAALCKHGPLSVTVRVTRAFMAYTGGVFNENDPGPINHCIELIGWDDDKGSWLVKNAWGTGWGTTEPSCNTRGFMWIAYGSNSIGKYALWIDARKVLYPLPVDFEKRIP